MKLETEDSEEAVTVGNEREKQNKNGLAKEEKQTKHTKHTQAKITGEKESIYKRALYCKRLHPVPKRDDATAWQRQMPPWEFLLIN